MALKKIKHNNGMALAVVLMLIVLMFLIGTAFASISAFQNKQASTLDKGVQAHYLARAGTEAALEIWMDAPADSKPIGTLDPVYLNKSNQFTNSSFDNKGKFEVDIQQDALDPETTHIVVTGTVDNVKKKVTVTVNTVQTVTPNPDYNPTLGGGKTEDDPSGRQGFFKYNSGIINPDNKWNFSWPESGQPTTGVVKNETTHPHGLRLQNKQSRSATQVFEKILFASPLKIMYNDITLKSDVIVFMTGCSPDFSANTWPNDGDLVLKVYSTGLKVPGRLGNWGIVIFEDTGYYFKDGVVLDSQSDINSQSQATFGDLVKITDPDVVQNHINDVQGAPLTTTSYSILWSN